MIGNIHSSTHVKTPPMASAQENAATATNRPEGQSTQTVQISTCARELFNFHIEEQCPAPVMSSDISDLYTPSRPFAFAQTITNLATILNTTIDGETLRNASQGKNLTSIYQNVLGIVSSDESDSQKIDDLHYLSYQTFAGTTVAFGGVTKVEQAGAAYQLLSASLYIESDPKDIASLFLATASMGGLENYNRYIREWPDVKFGSPGQEDDLIKISHGGGYHYLTDVILSPNVTSHAKIWVTPHHDSTPLPGDRDMAYALRNPPRHCDLGAILTAEIPAKYLQRTDNSYALLLSVKDAAQLQNVNIRKLDREFVVNHSPIDVANLLPISLLERNDLQAAAVTELKDTLQQHGLKPEIIDRLISSAQHFTYATLARFRYN